MYQLLFSPQAQKYAKKIAASGLKSKVNNLLSIIKLEPTIIYLNVFRNLIS